MLFAYLDPGVMYPVASIIGAAIGGILMFWRRIWLFGRRIFRRSAPAGKNSAASSVAASSSEQAAPSAPAQEVAQP